MDLARALALVVSVVSVVSVVTWAVTLAAASICPGGDAPPATFALTLSSRRNATGHRHVKVDVGYPESTRAVQNSTDDILLEVTQRAYEAGGIKKVLITTSFVARDLRAPPPGYELAAGLGWYRLHVAPRTWEGARLACEADGAHLAVLNSPREAAALRAIYDRAPANIADVSWQNFAYIGFLYGAGVDFHTIFGETVQEAGYAVWDSGQPNKLNSPADAHQNCGGLSRVSGKLHDLPCGGKLVYFCEYAL